jgi:hypothetical protein
LDPDGHPGGHWSIASETSDEFLVDQTYDTAYDSEQSYNSEPTIRAGDDRSPIESLLPVGAVLVLGGGLLVLFGRRRRGAHM